MIEIIGAKELAADMLKAVAEAKPAMEVITKASAAVLRDEWRANARRTARKHGKLYPKTITGERVGVADWEIGPDSSKPQGGMGLGFEYGSVNQPPHLDAEKAADAETPRFAATVEAAAAGLL